MRVETNSLRHILIVTYGRSGSTLLQGILNTSEKVHMTGENGDFVYGFFRSYQALKNAKKIAGKNITRTPREPFFGIDFFDEELLLKEIRKAIDNQIMLSNKAKNDLQFIGYKEIRYPYKDDLKEYLSFLDILFENPIFIFIFRDLEEVLYSGMFEDFSVDQRESARLRFSNFEKISTEFSRYRENAKIVNYMDLKNNLDKILGVFESFKIPIDKNSVYETVKKPHSYTWKDKNIY